jgi:hypothetical protein
MTPLEDKLRAALRESADEIPAQAPPLRLQPGRRTRWRRRIGWITPLAAAAVVVALIAVSLALAGGVPGHTRSAQPAQRQGVNSVPPYYVALVTGHGRPDEDNSPGTVAEVRATTTGAVLARIVPPKPYADFSGVTAAADDRTFVLVAEEKLNPPPLNRQYQEKYPIGYYPASRFFILHIDPGAGTSRARASLQPLPAAFIPANNEVHGMALSPDGASLAAVIGAQLGLYGTRLSVFNLASGTSRTWSFKACSRCFPSGGGLGYGGTNVDDLSWTADGRYLAFIGPGGASLQAPSGVRLLDTSAPGTNLLADSKPVVGGGPSWRGAIITPDGRTVVAIEELASQQVREQLVKFSAATGRETATLNNLNVQGMVGYEQVLYTNATGNMLVVSYARVGMTAGILHGDTYTPIPWTPQTSTAAW